MGVQITIDEKKLAELMKRLEKIDKSLNPAPRTPMSDLLNITGLDIARNAKKSGRCPVKTGRLRASIHPKTRPTETFLYMNNNGEAFDGTLSEQIEDGKEVVVGSNVTYAKKMESLRQFLEGGLQDSMPAMKRRMKSLQEQAVSGSSNITIS